MSIRFHDTYKKRTVNFEPINKGKVSLYTCGPTVYDYAHVGNLRYFIFEDTLRRTLEAFGFKVKHIMNTTDVGHLTSDEDEGEDKIEKGAKREQKTVWEVAEYYTKRFLADAESLNILKPNKLAPATKHIKEIIEIVEKLIEKGCAYETDQAVYFEVSKFPDYERLTGQKLSEKKVGVRQEVVVDNQKRHPADFAVWFKAAGRFAHHTMRWQSPWGAGFPGWHIECSAISRKYLGQPFDIHTGGVDHISVHHANEIAQSTAAYDLPLANNWLHSEFLLVEGQKMSKSLGNLLTLEQIKARGFLPVDFRYLVLTSHYRNKLNFTWEGLGAASHAFHNLKAEIEEYDKATKPDDNYLNQFGEALANDLDTPRALSILWEMVRESDLPTTVKRATVNQMDEVLGLGLKNLKAEPIPKEVKNLLHERDKARNLKDWTLADQIRRKIEDFGFDVDDTAKGSKAKKR